MSNYYCEYCGQKATSVSSLTNGHCNRHPDGPNEGRHALYEGDEKSEYTCKNCGREFSSLTSLTNGFCMRHPDGTNKGRHQPAL